MWPTWQAPVAAAGIPFLASVAMALPTVRRIVGDGEAFGYFEVALKNFRERRDILT